jgi:hypothetical protein
MKIAFEELKDNPNWGDAYWEFGYLIITGVFQPEELERIRQRFDRWHGDT